MIDKLKKYTSQLGFEDLKKKLDSISSSLQDSKAPLTLPLVGEFSAGKTTLINTLSDSKALESASEPTTATIYALHFGASEIRAVIHYQDGTVTETPNISDLHNKQLTDATIVEVFDTSSKVSPSIMLVDTPGLSSHDIKHRQNLVDFLPQADGVLLIVDVNQPITRSLTEFAKIVELSKRPIYMVITQCDTKSAQDIELQKKYILDNTELHLSGIACVSAKDNDLKEFYTLLDDIQADKTHILSRVNEYRCKDIAQEMVQRIDALLNASESDDAIEEEIRKQQLNLNKLRRELDSMIAYVKSDIESERRSISLRFEDTISNRLESIVTRSSDNFDTEVISAVNNTSSLFLNEFKTNVKRILRKYADKCEGLSAVNVSQYSLDNMDCCYNLNLNDAGHEYDSAIGNVLKVAAVVSAVVTTAHVVSAAASAAAKATTGAAGNIASGATETASAIGNSTAIMAGNAVSEAEKAMTVANIADTATDVASIVSNRRTVKRIGEIVDFSKKHSGEILNGIEVVNKYDSQAGEKTGCNKGIIQSVVGFATERLMGRPQRKKMISKYIDETLAPLFQAEITRISLEISNSTKEAIIGHSQANVDAITTILEQLRKDYDNQRAEFDKKIKLFKTIKADLITL